ncbi:MAG: HAMP domain-containing histidine kinase, partial [Pseudomonadales bacterium]|nr:HAMP domain-containing histidine kinase [Pseudomonadales bacterium]
MNIAQGIAAIRDFLLYEESQQRRAPEVDWLPVRQAQLTRVLQSLPASFAALTLAVGVWGLLYWLTRSPWCLVWAVLVHAAQLWRAVQTIKVRRQGAPPWRIAAIIREQTVCLWLLGCAWGLAPWMLGSEDSVAFLTVVIFMVGLNASVTVVMSSLAQVVIAFVLPAMLGVITHSMYFGGVLGWVLALYLIEALLVSLHWTFVHVAELEKSLRTGFENESLARQLSEQVERVQASEREKNRFIAAASHDLRQPLHAATLFAEALLLSDNLNRHDRELSQRAKESLAVLAASLNGMLDISRLDAGAVTAHVQPLSLQEIFISLQHNYEPRAEEKNLALRIRAPGDLWVHSDALLLERMLSNLLDNAIKYTRQGGVLIVARPCPAANQAVNIDVIDTGAGIAVAHQERIFDEYYQIHNPQRDRDQGLGLGLSIVKRLSALLGHPLTLRSRPGRGCRFSLQLPRAAAPLTPLLVPQAPLESAAALSLPRQVLLLDD